MWRGHFFGRFQFVCFVLIAYHPHLSFQDCALYDYYTYCTDTSGCNSISSACYCWGNAMECCLQTVFPPFSYFNSYPITYITVWGSFTNIYDNAYYVIASLNDATVCLEQQYSQPSTLTTYEDTFATINPNGITSLQFFYYNPINLTTVSNNQDLTSLLIQKSNLETAPVDAISHFPNLNALDLSNNKISSTVQLNSASIPSLQSIILNHNQITQIMVGGPSLSKVDVSYNKVAKIDANSFAGPSLSTVDASYNQVVEIDANSFAGPSLTNVDVSYNQVAKIDANTFASPVLTKVNVNYNQIATLAANSFQSSSSSPVTVTAKNNSLTLLNNTAFNFTSKSISIDVSNNKITTVDQGFSKWIQASTNFTLNLSNNPLPCDSTIQWMGTFVVCPPVKIILAKTETCPNGEPVYNYLVPYAKCG